ncbi:hypothetical protein IC582_020191 [Cucumis melo]
MIKYHAAKVCTLGEICITMPFCFILLSSSPRFISLVSGFITQLGLSTMD